MSINKESSIIQRPLPIVDQVYAHLRQLILTGGLAPGARLVESQLAAQLAVSRSPVRESLRSLRKDGLVVAHGGCLTVFQPSRRDFEELYELRLAIEPTAVRLAANRCSGTDWDVLAVELRESETAAGTGDVAEFVSHNSMFHSLIVSRCANRRLQGIWADVKTLMDYYRYIVFDVYHRPVASSEDHWSIYEALKSGDAPGAQALMLNHLEHDLEFIQNTYVQGGDSNE